MTLVEQLRDDDDIDRRTAHDPTYERQLRREAADALEAAQRDAERYRHIRNPNVDCYQFHHTVSDDHSPPSWQLMQGADLDNAIDAAIAQQSDKRGGE